MREVKPQHHKPKQIHDAEIVVREDKAYLLHAVHGLAAHEFDELHLVPEIKQVQRQAQQDQHA